MELTAQSDNASKTVPRVVIVGCGFGGLYAAKELAHAPVSVTIIDRNNYHLFRPMLYQVATGLLGAEEVAAPIRSILRNQKNANVVLADVTGVDTAGKRVLMDSQSIPYDYLILATGSTFNYFGHDDWQENAPGLSSIDNAGHIRSRIFRAFESAERIASDPDADKSLIEPWTTFALVGGGTTGVEMAGAIAELANKVLGADFRHLSPNQARVMLFEAGPRILSGFPEDLADSARRRLEALGVSVQTNAKVTSVDEDSLQVNDERIDSRTIVWTAGVAASPAGGWLGAEVDKNGRVIVNPDLTVPGHPDVFVIGDTASVVAPSKNILGVPNKGQRTLPGVAQPAMQEGSYAASVIRRRVRRLRDPRPFCYRDKGDLAIVGRAFAIANLKIASFSGLFAWLVWLGVHIFYLIGFANRLLVMTRWAFAFFSNHGEAQLVSPEDKKAPNPQLNS